MWNKIKTFKGNKCNLIPNIMKYKDEYIKTNLDIAQAFADLFKTNNSNQNHTESFLKHKNEVENSSVTDSLPQHSEDLYNSTISMDELNQALLKCKSKSPGPDDIPYILLHHLSSFAQQKLLVYNIIWEYGLFPNQWRKAIIIPIPKPDKNKFHAENYRPISLISTLCKLLEKKSTQDSSEQIILNKIGETLSTTHTTENGVPQGSVISVTLFLVAINNIFDNILLTIKYTIFADDCNNFCSGVNIKTTVEFIQQALDELLKWFTMTGFNVSPSKTQSIIFNKKRNENIFHINLNNNILPYTDKIKILDYFWIIYVVHDRKNVRGKSTSDRRNTYKNDSIQDIDRASRSLSNKFRSIILKKLPATTSGVQNKRTLHQSHKVRSNWAYE
ncbi:hypothetical protein QTP88_012871 [Uroleucon formosanum]